MRYRLFAIILLSGTFLAGLSSCTETATHNNGKADDEAKLKKLKKKVKHIVVIYQENWSFDGLYGKFPGANNLDSAGTVLQYDLNNKKLDTLPQPKVDNAFGDPTIPDSRFKGVKLEVKPYNLLKYQVSGNDSTGDIVHRFYTEQHQIHGGKMDRYVALSTNGGLVLSYFDSAGMPETKLAHDYTLCDNFFHSAFGGSFLNHIWLVSAKMPRWPNADKSLLTDTNSSDPKMRDNVVSPEGYAINTCQPNNIPHRDSKFYLPLQKDSTIGDLLSSKGIKWTWYSGGWNDALNKVGVGNFQFHHQPFVYFSNFDTLTPEHKKNREDHLKDEKDFFADVKNSKLPAVSFIKPYGLDNEHPGYARILRGQKHVDSIINALKASPDWEETVVIIAYDENGGRWDHVSPPKSKDGFGPGTRVPAMIISPLAKTGFVDHTQYETVSILKFIENIYGLPSLSKRDEEANYFLNAFKD